jgi:hypothetical protein
MDCVKWSVIEPSIKSRVILMGGIPIWIACCCKEMKKGLQASLMA